MAVTMARPFQRSRHPVQDVFGERRRRGNANSVSSGRGKGKRRRGLSFYLGWEHGSESTGEEEEKIKSAVPAAALFEEEVLIKAALNCNQELIVKLLSVIRASHAHTALVYSATCNNTLGPCFYFSNLGSDHFCYKCKQSELLEEE